MIDGLKFGVTVAVEAPLGSPFPIVHPDIYHTLSWLRGHGFDSAELHLRAPELVNAEKVRAFCAQNNLEISSIGTGQAAGAEGLFITSEDASVRRRAIDRIKAQIDLAQIVGGVVIMGSMRGDVGKRSFAEHDRRMVDAMRELADYAGPKGIDLVIEAIDRYETDYLHTSQDVLDVIERIGCSNVKVHLDTFHMNLEEDDMVKPVLLAGDKLGHVHVADNNRNYPGWGHLPLKGFLKALKQIHYKGSVVIECFPVPDGYTAVERGLEHLRNLLLAPQ